VKLGRREAAWLPAKLMPCNRAQRPKQASRKVSAVEMWVILFVVLMGVGKEVTVIELKYTGWAGQSKVG